MAPFDKEDILNSVYDDTNKLIRTSSSGSGGVSVVNISSSDVIDSYKTHDIEEDGTTTYVGKQDVNGTWLIMKIVEVGDDTDITYANISNNVTKTTYTTAWTDRTTLTYVDISDLTFSGSAASTYLPDYFLEISKGNVPGHKYLFKFGGNAEVGTDEEVLWDDGNGYTLLTAAETISVVSDDVNDTSTGTGARTVLILGLDGDYLESSEVVTLNGTTPVITTKQFVSIYSVMVLTSGTATIINDANEGTLTFTTTGTITLQAKILPRIGQTQMCVYTVPAGKTGYFLKGSFVVGKGKECTFRVRINNGFGGAFSTKYVLPLYQSAIDLELKVPLKLPAKTTIAISAQAEAGEVSAQGSFGILLVDD